MIDRVDAEGESENPDQDHAARLAANPAADVPGTPRMGRGERARRAALLFLLYFFIICGHGHGVFTVGLMLFFPQFPAPMVTGWIGTGLLALALLPGSMRAYRIVTLGGIVLCCCSILLAIAVTDAGLITLIFSIPFAVYALSWMTKVGWRLLSDPEGPG